MSLSIPTSSALKPSNPDGQLSRHAEELDTARQVQKNLFPEELPQVTGWTFAAHCRPARIVAGDYYDVFEVAPGLVAIALGDVSGKGLGPALVMAELHALVCCLLPWRLADLAGLMAELNDYLLASTLPDMFVTLFLGILETATGRLRYINAGHPAPLVLSCQGEESLRLSNGGTLLGVLPTESFDTGEVDLAPGDLLALFSDGVTDAMNLNGERFHERRVVEIVRALYSLPAAVILSRFLDGIDRFVGEGDATDDISLVIVCRQGDTQANGAAGGHIE